MNFTKITYTSGDRYGMLTLTGKSFIQEYGGGRRRFIESICDCGAIIYTYFESVKRGLVKSCGCNRIAAIVEKRTIHGMGKKGVVRHAIYSAWMSMKGRCYNPKYFNFKNWGGRGIIVYDGWLNNFQAFYDWSMGNGWEGGLSLDRFPNNDGNYEPSNCRWATESQQKRNKSNNHLVTAFGETKCLEDWTNDGRCQVSHAAVFYRISIMKWSVHDALFKPNTRKKKCPVQL